MRTDERRGGWRWWAELRSRRWSPWWAVLLGLGCLASLLWPLALADLWITVDEGVDLGPVDGVGLVVGRMVQVVAAVVSAGWLVFLLAGGRAAFGVALALTAGAWGWALLG